MVLRNNGPESSQVQLSSGRENARLSAGYAPHLRDKIQSLDLKQIPGFQARLKEHENRASSRPASLQVETQRNAGEDDASSLSNSMEGN